jgi:hypothetical protein
MLRSGDPRKRANRQKLIIDPHDEHKLLDYYPDGTLLSETRPSRAASEDHEVRGLVSPDFTHMAVRWQSGAFPFCAPNASIASTAFPEFSFKGR